MCESAITTPSWYVGVLIFDRRLWYDETPTVATLTNYDAVTLYLDKDGNSGSAPDTNSYRFVGQVNQWEPRAGLAGCLAWQRHTVGQCG